MPKLSLTQAKGLPKPQVDQSDKLTNATNSAAGHACFPSSLFVRQPGRLNPGHADNFILIARAAARTRRTKNLAAGILDQYRASLRQKLAFRGVGQRGEEIRIVLRAFHQGAARCAHRHRAPGLAGGDIDAEHGGAVFARAGLHVAGFVQHGNAHRLVAHLF